MGAPAMLFPVVLFGTVWADLNRPVSKVEVEKWVRACLDGKRTSRWELARRFLRGRVLAARIRPGMTQDDVARIAGAIPRGKPRRGGNGTAVECEVLDLWVGYRDETLRINGQAR